MIKCQVDKQPNGNWACVFVDERPMALGMEHDIGRLRPFRLRTLVKAASRTWPRRALFAALRECKAGAPERWNQFKLATNA